MIPSARQFLASGSRRGNDLRELLQQLLVGEFLAPSRSLWLAAPSLRNVPILDNRASSFAGAAPDLPRRSVLLSEVLAALRSRGTELVIVTSDNPAEQSVLVSLRSELSTAETGGPAPQINALPGLGTRGLVADRWALTGSFRFTNDGLDAGDDVVTLITNPAEVQALRLSFSQRFGGRA